MKLVYQQLQFSLAISGQYQWPETTPDCERWMMVDGQLTVDGRSWVFRDQCLLWGEIIKLADWLEVCALGVPKELQCEFTEPTLRFQLECETDIRWFKIKVECWPPPSWVKDQNFIEIKFPLVEGIDLASAAIDLRHQLGR